MTSSKKNNNQLCNCNETKEMVHQPKYLLIVTAREDKKINRLCVCVSVYEDLVIIEMI